MAWRAPKIAATWAILFISLSFTGWNCKQNKSKTLPYYVSPNFTPHWQITPALDHTIATFSAYNQNGEIITQHVLKDKISLVNFFFTSCGSICPKMTKNLKWVMDSLRLEPKVQCLSFTVTPWIDSLPRLKKFANRYQILTPQWHLLNGPKTMIYPLARRSFFAEEEPGYDKSNGEFLHTELVLLVDQNLRLRGVYNGTQKFDAEKMIEDIHILLNNEPKP